MPNRHSAQLRASPTRRPSGRSTFQRLTSTVPARAGPGRGIGSSAPTTGLPRRSTRRATSSMDARRFTTPTTRQKHYRISGCTWNRTSAPPTALPICSINHRLCSSARASTSRAKDSAAVSFSIRCASPGASVAATCTARRCGSIYRRPSRQTHRSTSSWCGSFACPRKARGEWGTTGRSMRLRNGILASPCTTTFAAGTMNRTSAPGSFISSMEASMWRSRYRPRTSSPPRGDLATPSRFLPPRNDRA